ncbi:MAG: alpha/beta hydrolase [Anaerolineae bacterium]|nr:alpha/beta hydrolase [Anaerolineae bacterium]MCI0610548.1 alpha/beta hydrolase [Anaerolineae bacterium]
MKTKLTPFMRLSLTIVILLTSIAAAPFSQPNRPQSTATQDLLDALGGVPCFDGSLFTCVTIEMPLDHFNPADTRTIPVTFAVLPAYSTRKGMFVTATGGPGFSGVASADPYTSAFDPSIPEIFDIVFFDQRGLLLSGDQTCPFAAGVFYQQDSSGITPEQEAALKQTAETFSTNCVNEVSNPDLLPYLGTKQAVEDLELFRQMTGDDKFWLYGESYGTQYAQTYAAAHGEHLAGLILDGTVDLTYDGIGFYTRQAQAFNDVLTASLAACNDDPACNEDLLEDAIAAYDTLASQLSQHPISFRFPLPLGGFAKRQFTLSNLEYVAASQMYTESDRMMFVRALAAYTSNNTIVPLARLLYIDLGLDPQTLDLILDPYYSDAVFFGVECQDYGYPGNTPDEKAELYLDAADPVEASIPRLASIIYGDFPCAYWPFAISDLTRPDYLTLEGVPMIVLGATADPATPVGNGINVFQHLADGYLITQQGGPHVIFGRGNECPDALVTDFLVNDVVPSQRETICDGFLMDDYVPISPRLAGAFKTPRNALSAVETEIYYLPEYFYWDGFTPTAAGCTYGGTLDFDINAAGTRNIFTLEKCAFTKNFIMTGSGFYNIENDRFVLEVRTTGRWKCNLKYARTGEKINITGKCDGRSINENHNDDDQEKHKAPDHKETKEDH